MIRFYFIVISVLVMTFSGTAYCFNPQTESMRVIESLRSGDVNGLYRLSGTFRKDERQVKPLKSFQKDQKREEFLKQYQYDSRSYFEIVNGNALVRYLESEKKKLRNGKKDFTVYYELAYEFKESAGTDYNKKIRRCVIAITFNDNAFSKLSVMDNPAPEYWQ